MIEFLTLPDCPFRCRHPDLGDGRYWCDSPHIHPQGVVAAETCAKHCHEELRKPVEQSDHQQAVAPKQVRIPTEPCEFLGEYTGRTVVCETCKGPDGKPGKVRLKVFNCSCPGRVATATSRDCLTCKATGGGYKPKVAEAQPVAAATTGLQPFPIRFDEHNLAVGLSGKRFNSSLIEWRDGYALAWRSGWAGSDIWISLLDKDFNIIPGKHTKLDLTHSAANWGREDPRLFMFAGQLHVSYIGVARNRRVRRHGHNTNVLYVRLSDAFEVEELFFPKYPQRNVWEKNWSFFESGGKLFAVYSVAPHRILAIDGEKAELAHENPPVSNWRWGGEPRGGAAPMLIGNEWYHWFHAWKPTARKARHYATGLYTFSAEPPFRILRMTPEPIIEADSRTNLHNWYADVIFTCGAVRRANDWILSSGEHDLTTRLDRFIIEEVESKLKPVS